MADSTRSDALEYHRIPEPGKIEIVPTKPFATPEDLALAYSPGVAYPCIEISNDATKSYDYTNRGNLVAVISNGTAVLGLGDIGAEASKPVMEGKAMLFKIFANVDAYDIELDATDPKKVVEIVKALAPTFGGINLEDIKAPDCFEIENELRKNCDIPIMHDDQHGTAIIVGAGMINALELQGKSMDSVRMVVNGAGAAAIACTDLLVKLGMKKENIVMCDSKGVIHKARTDLNEYKSRYASDTEARTLAEAMSGADVFLGLSVANVVTPEMLASMAPNPIVFALANPDPEISYSKAMATRTDLIYATGRSDLPNQINNVLGFPYIFRGALDSRASTINDDMKLAAARAIATIAHKPVPQQIRQIYNMGDTEGFGPNYILPKPFDRRLLTVVAPAVVQAAMDSGVARRPIVDLKAYASHLKTLVSSHDAALAHLVKQLAKRA